MSNGTNIRVSTDIHKQLTEHLKKKEKIGAWTDEAILEKIEREKTLEVPTLQQLLCGPETKI